MQFALLIYGDEAQMMAATPETTATMMAAYGAYTAALKDAGVLRGGERLRPTGTATAVRVRDGAAQTLDGPFAETKEQFGGFFAIDVPDLDAALSWAAKCPGAQFGTVEVRPIWPMME